MMIVVKKIFSLAFDSVGGQAVTWIAGLAVLVLWWQIDRAGVRRDERAHVEQKASKSAVEIAGKIRAAGDAADRVGDPVERLRRQYCRDCNR